MKALFTSKLGHLSDPYKEKNKNKNSLKGRELTIIEYYFVLGTRDFVIYSFHLAVWGT